MNNWRRGRSYIVKVLFGLTALFTEIGANHLSSNTYLYDVVPPGSGAPYGAGHVVQYVHIQVKLHFNEARAICTSLGGDMAKVETPAKYSWIASLDNDPAQDLIFAPDHMWSGLTEKIEDSYIWVADCSNDVDEVNVDGAWDGSKFCFLLAKAEWRFDRKKCDENREILCELPVAKTLADMENHDYSFNGNTIYPNTTCIPTATPTVTTSSTSTTATSSTSVTTSTSPTSTTTSQPDTTSTSTSPAVTTSTSTTSTTTSPTVTVSTTSNSPPVTSTLTPLTTSTSVITSTSPTSTVTSPSITTSTTSTSPPVTTSTSTPPTTSTSPHGTTSTSPTVTTTGTLTRCVPTRNVSTAEAKHIAEEISKNLTVDAKETSSHRRKLTCADDNRPSSKTIGTAGIVVLVVLFSLMFFTDLIKVCQQCGRCKSK